MVSMVLNLFQVWIVIVCFLSDCMQTQWSDWGECNCKGDKGTWSRTREIVIEPEYNGTECGPNEATEACPSGKCVGISKDCINKEDYQPPCFQLQAIVFQLESEISVFFALFLYCADSSERRQAMLSKSETLASLLKLKCAQMEQSNS